MHIFLVKTSFLLDRLLALSLVRISALQLLLAVLEQLCLRQKFHAQLLARADFSLYQEVEVLVVGQRLLAVLLAEEPRVVSQVQALALVVALGSVFGHSRCQGVGQLVLTDLKAEV